MTSPSVYSERVVCFIDILGFADLVRRADKNPALRDEIVSALHTVRSVKSPTGGDTDLRVQNFSDSLILSTTNTADGLWHLLLSADALAWNLLQKGILVRGGATIDGMHHDDAIVFGVGVNEAYRLESTVAKVPRIMLGRRAMEAAKHYAATDEIWANYKNSRLLRDTDGVWHLNYLTEIGVFNRQDPDDPEIRKHPLYIAGESIKRIIQYQVDETLDQPDIYAKVEWIARYWNAEVVGLSTQENPALGPITLAGQEMRASALPFLSC